MSKSMLGRWGFLRFCALAALLTTVLLSGACGLLGGGEKPVIRLHGGEYDSNLIDNAIVEYIIEEGYGYPVEIVEMTNTMVEEALPKGEIDLTMEGWQQNRIDWYNENIGNGNVVNLGMTYEAGPQFFIIPKWVAEQYNIKTVFDMKDHWELFKDPQDPAKGAFYNGITGWIANDINIVKLEAYGLSKYYNIVTASSVMMLEATLENNAQEKNETVFGYYWAPNALMGAHDWHILEEPPYSKEVWGNVTAAARDESLRPIDKACAYEAFPIDKIAHSGLQEKAPDVVEMLRKMMVGMEPLNETLAWAEENDVQDWEDAAIHYLRSYKDRWETWVTPEVYERIEEALEEASR